MTHKRFFLELLLALVGYAAAVLISGQSLAGTEPGAGRVFSPCCRCHRWSPWRWW